MTSVQELTRVIEAREVPAPGRYEIDPAHSSIEAVARHLMVTKVRGRFGEFSGTVEVAERPEDSKVEATIQAASIDTKEPQRDEHLRSPDFLDVERHPTITFVSTSVAPVGGNRWKVVGDLTIRDVSQPVELDVEFVGAGVDPWGNARIGFSAATRLNRDDFGITWNQTLDSGGVLVSKSLDVTLDVQAVRA